MARISGPSELLERQADIGEDKRPVGAAGVFVPRSRYYAAQIDYRVSKAKYLR